MAQTTARTIGFHLLGWLLFFSLIAAFVFNLSGAVTLSALGAFSFLLFVLIYLFIFYLNTEFLLPEFYLRRRFVIYFIATSVLFAAVYFFQPFDRLVMLQREQPFNNNRPMQPPPQNFPGPPPPRPQPMNETRSHQELDIVSIVLFLAVWSASSVLEILRQWRITERRAIRAEADKVSAELSFLKAQVNPHFLFNTLNNIYSLAIVKSEHTPDAILKLSDILRYVTDEANQHFVPLASEVDCARNYIALQGLRLNKKVTVSFATDGNLVRKKIAPLLFMTFIENAFKYGISNREECEITIRISAGDDKVHLFCRNTIVRKESEEREGVGINNAKKRLAYLYPENYQLTFDTENNLFTVNLIINT